MRQLRHALPARQQPVRAMADERRFQLSVAE